MRIVHLRASSLSSMSDCFLRSAAQNPDIWEVAIPQLPSTPPAWTGTSLHRATAVYDQATHIEDQAMSAADATDVFLENFRNPDEEVDWTDVKPRKIEPVGIRLIKEYVDKWSARFNFIAVEQDLGSMDVDFPDLDLTIRLTGHVDRTELVDTHMGYSQAVIPAERTIDIKSGIAAVGSDGAVNTKTHMLQLAVYDLLAANAKPDVERSNPVIVGLQTTGKGRIAFASVPGARQALVGTDEFPGALTLIAKKIAYGVFDANPKSMMCHPKYCPLYKSKCPYRG